MKKFLISAVFLTLSAASAQQRRLTVNWLVREDIFAGLLANDRDRLEKAAQTLDRVASYYHEADIVAWRFSIEMMRAIWAHEDGKPEDFRRHLALGLTYLDRCRATVTPERIAAPEIFEGAVYLLLSDRLPPNLRAGGWERAYQSYKRLNELEASRLEKLAPHMKGEVLAGLAVAIHRTGRTAELPAALAAVREKLPNTPYSRAADRWIADPASATKVRMACLTCHEPNTLGPKLDSLHKVTN